MNDHDLTIRRWSVRKAWATLCLGCHGHDFRLFTYLKRPNPQTVLAVKAQAQPRIQDVKTLGRSRF